MGTSVYPHCPAKLAQTHNQSVVGSNLSRAIWSWTSKNQRVKVQAKFCGTQVHAPMAAVLHVPQGIEIVQE